MNRSSVPTIVALAMCCVIMASPAARAHQLGVPVAGYKVGDKLPFERLEFIGKGGFDLEKYRGKEYVFIFFWSRYFKHYRETLALGSRLNARYKKRDLAFLGVNLDSNWEKVEESLIDYDIGFPHTYNPYLTFPAKLLGAISQTEGSVVIINKEGEVAFLWQLINDEDYKDISRFLDKNLKPIK